MAHYDKYYYAMHRQPYMRAQAAARLGMQLAVARLQDTAGADRRVTGAAASSGAALHPHCTGVWPTNPADPTWTGPPDGAVWLVSGTPDPDAPLAEEDSVTLLSADASMTALHPLKTGPRRRLAISDNYYYAL